MPPTPRGYHRARTHLCRHDCGGARYVSSRGENPGAETVALTDGSRFLGRPPKDPAYVRSLHLDVDVSPSEIEALRDLAAQLRLPLRTFVREAALGAKLPRAVPVVNAELARDLARVGGNLNQLLHAVHIGKV